MSITYILSTVEHEYYGGLGVGKGGRWLGVFVHQS